MTIRKLQSENDLFEYLTSVSEALRLRGEHGLASDVEFASRFASGSASEFLHHANEALKKIRVTVTWDKRELEDIDGVISQIEDAFNAIGGA